MCRSLLWTLVALFALLLSACGVRPAETPRTAPPNVELQVFAAASLTEAFQALGKLFSAANPGVTVVFNFAGSQQLAAQITQGAPADVFASANRRQMEVAIESGRVISPTVQTFVRNRLVVVTPQANPAALATLQDLAKPGVKLVLADPAVPVGQYSLDMLDRAIQDATFGAAFKDTVLNNVVSYEENVRVVLTKVLLGEADAGIVYTSDVALDRARVGQIAIPDALNTIASYPIAPINDSAHPEQAQRFVDFVLSADGQTILAQYGFLRIDQ